jgi:hypothetical protein
MKLKTLLALALALLMAGDHFGHQKPKLGPGRKYTSVERMDLNRLRSAHESVLAYANSRQKVWLKTGYKDARAILHAHAQDSPHTGGTRPDMLEAARRAGVQVILLTDHV